MADLDPSPSSPLKQPLVPVLTFRCSWRALCPTLAGLSYEASSVRVATTREIGSTRTRHDPVEVRTLLKLRTLYSSTRDSPCPSQPRRQSDASHHGGKPREHGLCSFRATVWSCGVAVGFRSALALFSVTTCHHIRKPIVLIGNNEHALFEIGRMHVIGLGARLSRSVSPMLRILKVVVLAHTGGTAFG